MYRVDDNVHSDVITALIDSLLALHLHESNVGRYFEPRSDDEVGTPSPNYHTMPTGGMVAHQPFYTAGLQRSRQWFAFRGFLYKYTIACNPRCSRRRRIDEADISTPVAVDQRTANYLKEYGHSPSCGAGVDRHALKSPSIVHCQFFELFGAHRSTASKLASPWNCSAGHELLENPPSRRPKILPRSNAFRDESRFARQSDSRRVFIWRERGAHFHPSYVKEIDRFGGKVLGTAQC
ncbi:uncharacterized protein TNCV_282931 [Trichonephila clavipes]|nr:uncharacterized protein TNCV_282931 [Trichonephila clavipes]